LPKVLASACRGQADLTQSSPRAHSAGRNSDRLNLAGQYNPMHPKFRSILFSVVVLLSATSATAAKQPRSLAGDWEYTSAQHDAVYGEPEGLFVSIRVVGNRICGSYMSAYRGGMKVASGALHGTVSNGHASVTYEAGWAGVTGDGRGHLRLRGRKLEWQVTRPGPDPDYIIRAATLRPSKNLLQIPATCESLGARQPAPPLSRPRKVPLQ